MGTQASPWSLPYALSGAQADGKVRAGDSIYIMGGIYTGKYVSNLGFADAAPIFVASYPNARVTINGYIGVVDNTPAMQVFGVNTWYIGLEFASTATERLANAAPADDTGRINIYSGPAIDFYGRNNKLINCVVHDYPGYGVGAWKTATDTEYYGCIVYNNGHVVDTLGQMGGSVHGPGFYIQNMDGSQPQRFVNNIIFKNGGPGLQVKTVYPFPQNSLNGIVADSNTLFHSSFMHFKNRGRKPDLYLGSEVYTYNPADNIYMRANVFYRDDKDGSAPYLQNNDGKPAFYLQEQIALGTGQVDSFLLFHYNYIVGTTYSGNINVRNRFGRFDVQHNTIYDPLGVPNASLVGFELFAKYKPTDTVRIAGQWNNNRYFSNAGAPFWRNKGQTQQTPLSLSGVNEVYGIDIASSHRQQMPNDTAFIRPNKYDNGLVYVTVLNHSGQCLYSLPLQMPALLGKAYVVVDAQDYYGDTVAAGIYNGGPIDLPMGLQAVAPLTGTVPSPPRHTNTGLGVFIIRFISPASPNLMALSPPSCLQLNNVDGNTVQLTWASVPHASAYLVEIEEGGVWRVAGTTTKTYMRVQGLNRLDKYRFRIATQGQDRTSAYSAIIRRPNKYFVATNGQATNKGTLSSPWSLGHALQGNGMLEPGDTVFLQGGKYLGNYTAALLSGKPVQPIVFMSYDGERPVIDGYTGLGNNVSGLTITASCQHLVFNGIEVASSAPSRVSGAAGALPTGNGLSVIGSFITLANCIVHDMPGTGIAVDANTQGVNVYGCIVYNNGVEQASVAAGNGVSINGGREKAPNRLSNSFVFNNAQNGVISFGAANGLHIRQNVVFNTGATLSPLQGRKYNLLISGGAGKPILDATVSENLFYRDENDNAGGDKPHNLRYNLNFGQRNTVDSSLNFEDNYVLGGGFYGAVYVQGSFNRYSVQRNIIHALPHANNRLVILDVAIKPSWNYNRYHSNNSLPLNQRSFADWKTTTEQDAASLYSAAAPADTFMLAKNIFKNETYHVAVVNNSRSPIFNLPFEVPELAGSTYHIRDAQNYFGTPIQAVYNGQAIPLPLTLTEVASPMGTVASLPKHTTANLGTFVIEFEQSQCPVVDAVFSSTVAGANFQWQVSDDQGGFTNIADGAVYEGAKSSSLKVVGATASLQHKKYRCKVDEALYTGNFSIKRGYIWTGAADQSWENPFNWACGRVPDPEGEVILNDGDAIVISSNVFCKSITVNKGAKVTVKPGVRIDVAAQ